MKFNLLAKVRFISIGMFAFLLGTFVAITTLAWFPGVTPRQDKVFERPSLIGPQIVEIVEIGTKSKKANFGEAFKEDGEWLKGTNFKVRNHSGKEIVYLELRCDFPETASSGNEMSFPVKLGRWPNVENQKGEPVLIKPDEEVAIALSDDVYSRLKRFIEYRQPISSINKVRAYLSFVIFSDGIGWNGIEFLRQDSSDPKHYINIGPTPPQR